MVSNLTLNFFLGNRFLNLWLLTFGLYCHFFRASLHCLPATCFSGDLHCWPSPLQPKRLGFRAPPLMPFMGSIKAKLFVVVHCYPSVHCFHRCSLLSTVILSLFTTSFFAQACYHQPKLSQSHIFADIQSVWPSLPTNCRHKLLGLHHLNCCLLSQTFSIVICLDRLHCKTI